MDGYVVSSKQKKCDVTANSTINYKLQTVNYKL
jgi:hypothetical protein